MSTTHTQVQQFATLMLEHDAAEHVWELVDLKLFQRFRSATDQERKIITDLMDIKDLFLAELRQIQAGINDDEPVNDTTKD